jgi:predicted nucleic acid-binding protein
VAEPPDNLLDRSKIPTRFLIDSGVLMRALEYPYQKSIARPGDERPDECRALWRLALKGNHEIVIAPHTVFEFRLNDTSSPMPWSPKVQSGNFTGAMVEDLLKWLNRGRVNRLITPEHPRSLIKWDAMIVGCAKSERATHIFSLDDDVHKLAAEAKIPCMRPSELRSDAFRLTHPTPGPAKARPPVIKLPPILRPKT